MTREETFCCLIMTGAPGSTLSPCCCQARPIRVSSSQNSEPCKIHQKKKKKKAHDHVCLACFVITWDVQKQPLSALAVCRSSGCVTCKGPRLPAWLAVSGVQPHPGKRSPSTFRPLVKQASTFTSCGMWSEGGTKAIYRKLLYFSVTAVCLPRQFELLAVSSG